MKYAVFLTVCAVIACLPTKASRDVTYIRYDIAENGKIVEDYLIEVQWDEEGGIMRYQAGSDISVGKGRRNTLEVSQWGEGYCDYTRLDSLFYEYYKAVRMPDSTYHTGRTKRIQGRKCLELKHFFIYSDHMDSSEYWYDPKLPNELYFYQGVPGAIMELTFRTLEGNEIRIIAAELSPSHKLEVSLPAVCDTAFAEPFLINPEVGSPYRGSDYSVYGLVKDSEDMSRIVDVPITIMVGDRYYYSTKSDSNGAFQFYLPCDKEFTLIFGDDEEWVSKRLVMDLRTIPEEDLEGGFESNIDMTLFKPFEGWDWDILKEPIGICRFDDVENSLLWDIEYTTRKQEQVNAAFQGHGMIEGE